MTQQEIELRDFLVNTSNEISSKVEGYKKEVKTVKASVSEMAEDLNRLKEGAVNRTSKKAPMVDKTELADFIGKTFNSDGRKTSMAASFKLSPGLVFKTADIFGYDNFFGSPADTSVVSRTIDPTFYEAQRKKNLIIDYMPIGTVDTPKMLYVEKVHTSGGADWISSGGKKPQRSFEITTTEAVAKKIAIFGTIEDKLLRDLPSVENWIQSDFSSEMREQLNYGLLNGDGSNDDTLGLLQNAVTFTVTSAFSNAIVDPNTVDAICAACASMRESKETPGQIFVSYNTYYSLFVIKDGQGRYQNANLVYQNSMGQIFVAGVPVIPVDSDDVDDEHFLLLSIDPGFKIFAYRDLIFERGLNGEDFQYDRTSYRSYQEVISYIPEHRYDSVMYDSWTNVLNAIDSGS